MKRFVLRAGRSPACKPLQASVGRPTTQQQLDRITDFKIVTLRPKRIEKINGK